MFEFLIKKLKAHPRKIVFTEGTDPRILEASARLLSGTFLTPVLVGNAEEIAKFQQQKDDALEVMQTFATENRDELFSKKKSMETAHGVLGFRTGTPKLKTRKGFTWAAVLELLKEFNPAYVRTSEEVAKDKLLADRENEDMPELMQKVGIKVEQDETFFVEPKKEE